MEKDITKDWEVWTKTFGDINNGHISALNSLVLYRLQKNNHLNINAIPTVFKKTDTYDISPQPKHINRFKNIIIITSVSGKSISFYNFVNNKLSLIKVLLFSYQCIESFCYQKYLYVTMSDFSYTVSENDHIAIINLDDLSLIKTISSGGKWSKAIKAHPTDPILVISNWFSNDLSIFDITDPINPKLRQILKCGISPRGIAFSSSGNFILIACYYSRSVIKLKYKQNNYYISYIGQPFDFPNYSGNMRDIIIDNENKFAYITNMGRSLLHKYDINRNEIILSRKIGKFPNTLKFFNSNTVMVSCSKENRILLINTEDLKILGKSEKTFSSPVGLEKSHNLVLTTSFDFNKIEIWKILPKQKEQPNS